MEWKRFSISACLVLLMDQMDTFFALTCPSSWTLLDISEADYWLPESFILSPFFLADERRSASVLLTGAFLSSIG